MSARRVVVIGAGLTGLVAARALAAAEGVEVTVLEADDRVGGQLRAITVPGGALVDVGAESVHLGAPHVAALVDELGLGESVVGARPGASVLAIGRRLVPLPAGVGPAGPTQVMPVLKARVLSPKGVLRAGLEPLMTRRFEGDISVGAFLTHRFGAEVVDTLVDPLLGNLHSGNVHGLSLQATAPALVPVARDGVSLLRRALAKKTPPARASSDRPMFASWPQGLTALTDALAAQSRATVLTGRRATSLERRGDGWTVHCDGDALEADAVVVTTPTLPSLALLEQHCPEMAIALNWVRTATVATVVLGYDRAAARRNRVMRDHNGLMLTTRQAVTMKAMTNLSRKWPTRLVDAEHHVIRVSVGNAQRSIVDTFDDATLIERCVADLRAVIGLDAAPQFAEVVRWQQAMPQLAPGHLDRVARARAALSELPGLHVAGAPFDGLGVGNTVKSGQAAAAAVLAQLASAV